MPKFRKKPIVIEAEQFIPSQWPWPKGVSGLVTGPNHPDSEQGEFLSASIETLEGVMDVSPGDWIITGVKGEKYPCKPDIFKMTYEPIGYDGGL